MSLLCLTLWGHSPVTLSIASQLYETQIEGKMLSIWTGPSKERPPIKGEGGKVIRAMPERKHFS